LYIHSIKILDNKFKLTSVLKDYSIQTFLIFSIWNFHAFSIHNGHFGQIQYFSKVLKADFEIQYFFNTAWEPCIHFAALLCWRCRSTWIKLIHLLQKRHKNAKILDTFFNVQNTNMVFSFTLDQYLGFDPNGNNTPDLNIYVSLWRTMIRQSTSRQERYDEGSITYFVSRFHQTHSCFWTEIRSSNDICPSVSDWIFSSTAHHQSVSCSRNKTIDVNSQVSTNKQNYRHQSKEHDNNAVQKTIHSQA